MTAPTVGEALTALGYAFGALVFFLAARRRRLVTEGMGWVALAGLCGGLLGAKVTQWLVAEGHLFTLDPRAGGRALIGGVLGGWLAVEVAKWRLGIRRSTGDLFALALPAGEAVGRLGCFVNGCCYGVASAGVPWHVFQHGAWRHPAQLYTALYAAALFVVLLALRERLSAREGDLFRLYLVLFCLGRFLLEFFRERSLVFAGLSLAQIVCLETAAAIALTYLLTQRRRRPAPTEA